MDKNEKFKAYLQRYILCHLDAQVSPEDLEVLVEAILEQGQLRYVSANTVLEEPGEAKWGQAYICIGLYAQSFQVMTGPYEDRKVGTAIWERGHPIFFPTALFSGQERTHYVQVLESGYYMSMSYAAVLDLSQRFPILQQLLVHFMLLIQQQFEKHQHIIALPPLERVQAFLATYPTFKHISTISMRAMHTHLARHTYSKYEKILLKES